MTTTRATERQVAKALAEACRLFDLPCMFNLDGSVKPSAWKLEPVRDDVTRAGGMHGAQGFQRGTSGKLSFFGYAPGSSGHARVHPVLRAIGLPMDTWEGITTRQALDLLTGAVGAARMAQDEATDDDLDAIR